MIFIFGQRRSGKTRAMIETAAKTGATIIVSDKTRADYLRKCAKMMGAPGVVVRVFETRGTTSCNHEVYVDDAEVILERVIGYPVKLATFDASRIDMRKMTFLDMLAEWRRQRRVEKYGGDV